MKYLGIDFGTKRIGIALSDESGKIAFPKSVIANDKHTIETIVSLAEREDVGMIVVGKSHDQKGDANPVHAAIDAFAKKLSATGCEVVFEDERFSSHTASLARVGKEMFHARKEKREEVRSLDASAAAIILQRYLDKK